MSKNREVKVEKKSVYKPIVGSNTVEVDGKIVYLDMMVWDEAITQEEIEKHIVK